MDDQLKDAGINAEGVNQPVDQQRPIDPLRRVFVPIEKRTANGTLVFRTLDKQVYVRLEDGSIRRATPKMNGKEARRLRAKSRAKHLQSARKVQHVIQTG
jgi:hypothetical protein